MDRLTKDEKGESWDFDVMAMRDQAEAVLREKRPKLLIRSPMCTHDDLHEFLNRERMGEEQYRDKLSCAVCNLEFMCHLYRCSCPSAVTCCMSTRLVPSAGSSSRFRTC